MGEKETKRFQFISEQFIAGSIAGGTAVLILHPLDLLKTRFQASATSEYQALFSVPRHLSAIYRKGGAKALYRGFSANFTGSTVSWGLYFLLYNKMQSVWGREGDGKNKLAGWQYFLSSASAGAMTVLVSNPIWLAKTRLCQPIDPSKQNFTGLFDCWQKTFRMEGVRGLYRGLVPGLLGTSHGAVQFTVYEQIKKFFDIKYEGVTPSIPQYLVMSSASKVAASAITYPYQVVRCRLQLSPGGEFGNNSSMLQVIGKTWRGEGLLGFYKGIVPNTLRVLPGTCITFLVYEELLAFLKFNDKIS